MRNTLNRNTEKLTDLYRLAEEKEILIDESCPPEIISMSVKLPNGVKVIGISNEPDEYSMLEKMAHEMGHCMTDSFYAGYSPFELRAKHENTANEWAVNKIVPFGALCKAVKHGYRELWELAEYFDVSCHFIEKAIQIHQQNGQVVPLELYSDI